MGNGAQGSMKIFPAKEMRAVDMAEALRGLSSFDGIISGCRIRINPTDDSELTMEPGWMILGGRLAYFAPQEGRSDVLLETPSSRNATVHICAVCDLRNGTEDFSIKFYTKTNADALINGSSGVDSQHPDYNFNLENHYKAIRLGTVYINATGRFSNLDVTTGSFPDYAIKSGKTYTDAASKVENTHWTTLSDWVMYFQAVKHRSAFFRRYTIVANGLKVAAGKSVTYQFRKEYGSQVVVKTGDTMPATPSGVAYVIIEPDTGKILKQGAAPASTQVEEKTENNVPSPTYHNTPGHTAGTSALNDERLNRGIVGINISGSDEVIAQSYYITNKTGTGDTNYVVVKLHNFGKNLATVNLNVDCLFVQNPNYPNTGER